MKGLDDGSGDTDTLGAPREAADGRSTGSQQSTAAAWAAASGGRLVLARSIARCVYS